MSEKDEMQARPLSFQITVFRQWILSEWKSIGVKLPISDVRLDRSAKVRPVRAIEERPRRAVPQGNGNAP
jgi:hypothetical protein